MAGDGGTASDGVDKKCGAQKQTTVTNTDRNDLDDNDDGKISITSSENLSKSFNQQRPPPPPIHAAAAAVAIDSTNTTDDNTGNTLPTKSNNNLDYDFEIAAALQAAEESRAAEEAAVHAAEAGAFDNNDMMMIMDMDDDDTTGMGVTTDCPLFLQDLCREFIMVLMIIWSEIFVTNDKQAMELGPYVFLEFLAEMSLFELGDLTLFVLSNGEEYDDDNFDDSLVEACMSLCCWEVHTDTTPTTTTHHPTTTNTTKVISQAQMRRNSFLVVCKFIDLKGPEDFEVVVKQMMDCECSPEDILLTLNKMIVDDLKQQNQNNNISSNNNTSSSTTDFANNDGMMLLDNLDRFRDTVGEGVRPPTKKARFSSESPTSVVVAVTQQHQQVDNDPDDGGGKVGSCYNLQKKEKGQQHLPP